MKVMDGSNLVLVLPIVMLLAGPTRGQCQVVKLLPPNASLMGRFGHSVAIDRATAVACSRFSHEADVFELIGDEWQHIQGLKPGGSFGSSVAISGVWLAVGADDYEPPCCLGAGAVYLYHRQGQTWAQKQILLPGDLEDFKHFGEAVDFDDTRLIIGAPFDDLGGGLNDDYGSAYVFELQGHTWIEVAKLTASNPMIGDRFGLSVTVDGNMVVVGAPQQFTGKPGVAFVFKKVGSTWNEAQKLVASDGMPHDRFGYSVALERGLALVGAPDHEEGVVATGVVYAFVESGSDWVEIQELRAADPSPYGHFGESVALSGTEAVIGCWGDIEPTIATGSAYYFRRIAGAWMQVGKLVPTNPTPGEGWGSSMGMDVALANGFALAGAPFDEEAWVSSDPFLPYGIVSPGAAFMFRVAQDVVQYCSCQSTSPCGNRDDHGGCVNSTSVGSVLQACGNGTVTTDELMMEARWLPENVLGIMVMGPTAQQSAFGDGQLCVGPGNTSVFGFAPQNSGSEGVITLGPGIVAYTHANFPPAGQIQPGQTWYFQAWYRDPAGPCGTGFNLTNGLKVDFKP